jgi:hypothetical protein
MDFTPRLDLLELLGQRLVAVAATHGQHGHGFIDPFGRLQLPVASRMALLSARLAPASAARRFHSPRGGWPIGRGRFGGVRGIFLPAGELALQIGDLLLLIGDLFLSVGDLLLRLGDLSPKPFVLFSESLVLSLQLLRVEWAPLGTQP